MSRVSLFMLSALMLLALSGSAESETFGSVSLYFYDEPEGILSINSPVTCDKSRIFS